MACVTNTPCNLPCQATAQMMRCTYRVRADKFARLVNFAEIRSGGYQHGWMLTRAFANAIIYDESPCGFRARITHPRAPTPGDDIVVIFADARDAPDMIVIDVHDVPARLGVFTRFFNCTVAISIDCISRVAV